MPINCMHAENVTESEEKAQAYARAFSILIYFINKSFYYFTILTALELIYPTNFPDFVYKAKYLYPFSCLYLYFAVYVFL